jgi:hypothetical protein|tara:strand:+ start:3190 stop:3420 length:231 start_codon:yes stop_codon:yes gene_type:complete
MKPVISFVFALGNLLSANAPCGEELAGKVGSYIVKLNPENLDISVIRSSLLIFRIIVITICSDETSEKQYQNTAHL